MKKLFCAVLLLSLVVSSAASAQQKKAAKTERKKDTGVEISTEPQAKAGGPITCKLTLSPSTATHGQTVSFSVSYTPCRSTAATETFTFPWASTLPDFTEVTVRQKIWKTPSGCIISSFDSTLVPTAGAIKGKFNATVEVKDGATLICTATAPMTVN
jgi:hypothetical protein